MSNETSLLTTNIDAPAALGAANALVAAPAPGQWLKLADYGDWPHPAGLQRFTRSSAGEMVRNFQSLWGRLRRRFGGVPMYVGHPDDPVFAGQAGHDDTRAYAWVTSLDAREDGLYILPRWSEAGCDMLRQAFYKFLSPRWQMRSLGDGTFEPVRLLSIGLTNQPNIPGESIANQQTADNSIPPQSKSLEDLLPQVLTALELDGSATPEVLLANAERLAQDARDSRSAQAEAARFYRLATDAEAARQQAISAVEVERAARVDLLLDLSELRNRITPVERANWKDQFQANFENTLTALANTRGLAAKEESLVQAAPLTADLAVRRLGAAQQGDVDQLLALVNERMTRTGENYATAFARTKRDHVNLFRQ